MKVLVSGAHFTPAVAVIEELRKIDKIEIVYVGRKTTLEGDKTPSVESQVLPELGVKFISIITGRLQRSFTIYTIPSLLKIPIGLLQAFYIILSEKPDVILSFGGYVAVPTVFAGWLFSVPIIIHEQTLVSGLANKISALFADKIAVSFKRSEFKGEKVILTGNPIRQEVIEVSKSGSGRQSELPTVLVSGGNQGSHVINVVVEQVLNKLLKLAAVYHQTGDSKFRDFERLQKKENDRYKVFKFISKDWTKVLAKSDLVISRAGINTLSELAFLGKPTLLIPIPNKEQNKNSRFFEELGLVNILPQAKLSGETLLSEIKLMLNDLKSLKEKAKGAKSIVIPDAAKRLALETIFLGQKTEK
ncbi:MAG: UDP-N-acetylglucosamine--N-acetylmuramyl-(pentapeptide) pyrophosphoryl-undecaprenol N-acetylglucosamine transferase [Patescibacteria group bacterium]|nr:UDP-N-acetylglucosamine--N-acetylmuramyl-(pentapeptide) pyrophosphoryl-undecaprenol N-acetylglucosamine transferase [Patescibacteria group bacterium]